MDLIEQIEAIRKIANPKCSILNEPMSKHTTFKTGGIADIFVIAQTKEELINLVKLDCDKVIIGNGSNLLVRDGGIEGLVVKVANDKYEILENDVIYVEAGMALAKLSQIALQNELTGLEFACGIPGTVGGAIYMNAGAYGSEMSNVVIETEYIDKMGNISIIKDHGFDYRKSCFQNMDGVILSTKIKLAKGNKEEIKAKMDENNKARSEKQPINKPSAGSTFKRPKDNFAAKLIQDANLKGASVGGAEVSTLHAGFIVNKGGATSSDILALIDLVKQKVFETSGVMLEEEVKIIGKEN